MVRVLERGVFPSCDQHGNPWPHGSARAQKIGQNVGVRACFAYWAGDLEAHAKSHSLMRHYNKSSICDWCWATKGDELSFANFSKTALWRSTRSYDEPLPHKEERSVWKAVKGFTKHPPDVRQILARVYRNYSCVQVRFGCFAPPTRNYRTAVCSIISIIFFKHQV